MTEFLRGLIFTGFPWLQFGYSQIAGPLRGLAPLAGVEAITFVLMIMAGLLTSAMVLYHRLTVIYVCLLLLLLWPLSTIRWYQPLPNEKIEIALVQGNIAQSIKWEPEHLQRTLKTYLDLTLPLIGRAKIIIWPESAIPDDESEQQSWLAMVDNLLRQKGSSLITGIIDNQLKDNNYYAYNSMLVLGDKQNYHYGNSQYYRKYHLVPFGEFVPYGNLLRPLAPLFNLPASAFSRGAYQQRPLNVQGNAITASICYEIVLGEQIRANFRPDTRLLLTISNDAWFGSSIGPWQHLQMARMRALELGRTLLRATNNGITAIIGPNGKIISSLPQFEREVLVRKVVPSTGLTPYARFGLWPVWLMTLIAISIALILQRREKNHQLS